jgi:2-polyprenyl-3-methyl-5-hydroxy-6-metoxy-1,4-benzoquinol methylase
MEHVKCNLCGSNEYKSLKKIDTYQLVKCKQCELVYLNPRPIQHLINEGYSYEYHINRILKKEPKTEKEIEEEINKHVGHAEELTRRCGGKQKLLDIGCSAGFFLACMKRHGWDVTGIEISDWASRYARERLGLNVFTGSVEDTEIKERFGVVTMLHILEHLPDPLRTLKSVAQIVENDGLLVIKGPNFGSFDRIWHGDNWRAYHLPSHLYHFTAKTYSMILREAGFEIKRIIFQRWNPITHWKEIRLGGGLRTDYPPDAVSSMGMNGPDINLLSKLIGKPLQMAASLMSLKGRDITIYAQKRACP